MSDLFQAQPGPLGAAERWAATLKPWYVAEYAALYARWQLGSFRPEDRPEVPAKLKPRDAALIRDYVLDRFVARGEPETAAENVARIALAYPPRMTEEAMNGDMRVAQELACDAMTVDRCRHESVEVTALWFFVGNKQVGSAHRRAVGGWIANRMHAGTPTSERVCGDLCDVVAHIREGIATDG